MKKPRSSEKYILKHFYLALVGVALIGCAGIVRQVVFAPEDHEGIATYGLIDAELTVFPIIVSEKLNSLYGPALILPMPTSKWSAIEEPLSIDLWIEVKRGKATLNLQNATFKLANKGQALEPIGIMAKTIHHFPNKRSELSYKSIDGKVTVSEREAPYRFVIMYGIERDFTDPFAFDLGSIELNGQMIHREPFIFSRTTRYISK